jgi:hypothetical protein
MIQTADVLRVFHALRENAIVVPGRGGRHWAKISTHPGRDLPSGFITPTIAATSDDHGHHCRLRSPPCRIRHRDDHLPRLAPLVPHMRNQPDLPTVYPARRPVRTWVIASRCFSVSTHPDVTAQAQRLGNVLKDAGLPVTVFGAKETTHNKLNADLGQPDTKSRPSGIGEICQ